MRRVEKLGNPRAGAFDFMVSSPRFSRCSTREPHLSPHSGVSAVRSMSSGWLGGIVGGSLRDHRMGRDGVVPRDQGRVDSIRIAGGVPPLTNSDPNWSQLDSVNEEDIFAFRVPMLKSCPHFLRRERVSTSLCANGSEPGWKN